MKYEIYQEQILRWPQQGRHILANFDDESISVYQAYRPAIARYAMDNQKFGGQFSFTRMSWIKPNFLWMMFRSGWATKEGQERILEIRLPRSFFDSLVREAVVSNFNSELFASYQEWKEAIAVSEVRLQWDPDHDPEGAALLSVELCSWVLEEKYSSDIQKSFVGLKTLRILLLSNAIILITLKNYYFLLKMFMCAIKFKGNLCQSILLIS